EKYGLKHLSTGGMLRHEISKETELGRKAKELIDCGQLVPDEMVIKMIEDGLNENADAKGFIFDGFPRTIYQAEMLDKMLTSRGMKVDGMISLDSHEDELVKRLVSRGKVSGRADDQDEGIIRDRIKVYHEKTANVIGYYKTQGKYISVNGVGSVDDIYENLCRVISKLLKQQTAAA
ncbi:MAG: adenylate kinase, partial [Prevotellaceae bacterium]|nr:adenylate kinase [Prevotellaceae bacterium]